MTEYFKCKFKPYLDRWRTSEKAGNQAQSVVDKVEEVSNYEINQNKIAFTKPVSKLKSAPILKQDSINLDKQELSEIVESDSQSE